MDAGIALYLTDERPIGLARVHLTAGATMNGQSLNATILQLLRQFGDDELFVVPAQACLHGDGQFHGIHHLAGDLQHLGYILQHSGSSTLASHLLHRTTEVQVDEIGACLFHDLCGLDHRLDVAPIDLDAHRTLLIADGKFLQRRLHIAYQGLGTDELCIDHRGPEPLAEQSEANVGDVFHRSEENGTRAKLDIAYFHGCKDTKKSE